MNLKLTKTSLALIPLAALALAASSASAAIVVVEGNITVGSLIGSGLIIDTPTTFGTTPYTGADLGWSHNGNTLGIANAETGWEPSGSLDNSPLFMRGEAYWTFDLPDGAVVNAVYAVWDNNGSIYGATYSYSEGAASGNSGLIRMTVAADESDGDLVYDGANFQNLITGPITVAGGDGFRFTATNTSVAAATDFFLSDAVIVDFTPFVVPEPSSTALLGLGGLALLLRRRRF